MRPLRGSLEVAQGPGRAESAEASSWRVLLKSLRAEAGLTQVKVAARAGIAPDTLRKYENGERTPSRQRIEQLIAALDVPQERARAMMRSLGYDTPDTIFPGERHPNYAFSVAQMREFVEAVRWPQFGTNNLAEIVAANSAAQRLWGIDFELELRRRSRSQLHFLAILAEPQARSKLVNWLEILERMVAVMRAIPASASLMDAPTNLAAEVFATFAENDPSAIPRLFALWDGTKPAPAKVRWNYPVVWQEPGFEPISFQGFVTTASEPDALSFNDWVPVDAASFATLEAVLAIRPGPVSPAPIRAAARAVRR